MGTLLLVRHGQSQWNLENKFTGWTDVPLTPQGEKDAHACGQLLKSKGIRFDYAFASALQRAQNTLAAVLQETGHEGMHVEKNEALNERHYGDLQGLNKAETVEKYGADQVKLWRRDYDTRPPNGESMADCEARVMPYFNENILPLLQQGKTVIVGLHGNSMRPIMKTLEGLDKETSASMELKFCTPYVYFFEGDTMVRKDVWEVPGLGATGTADISKK